MLLLLSGLPLFTLEDPAVRSDQKQELLKRIQTQIDVEPIPPPEAELVTGGTIALIGGIVMVSGGIWASVNGLEYRDDAVSKYETYQELGYLDDPDAYSDAYNDYRNTELKGLMFRVGGAVAVTTGIVMLARGIYAVRQAAAASEELAEQMQIDLSAHDARVRLHPMGVSILWSF